jgi:hypothetical protein
METRRAEKGEYNAVVTANLVIETSVGKMQKQELNITDVLYQSYDHEILLFTHLYYCSAIIDIRTEQ